VFIVGSLGDNGRTPAEILSIAEGRSGYLAQGGKSRKSPTTTATGSPTTVGTLLARDHKGIDQISVEENKLVLFDLPDDDKEQKNDALLFQATRNENIRIFEKHSPTLAVAGWLRSLHVFSPSNFANYSENDDVAATLRAGGGDLGGGSETLLVFDPHQTDGVRLQGNTTNTLRAAMGMGGNNVPMVAYPMHGAMVGRSETAGPNGSGFLDENDPSYTLTASSQARHGVVTVAESASMVRRLTPLECERLQGFPDHWTEGQTDGHRYKQLGNAVAVPVVQWIIERLVKVINEGKAQ
jgi:site-specific DNA-cytosine methylase